MRNSRLGCLLDKNPEEELSTPERRLLSAILSRAIYDLTPEAEHVIRRNSIAWFKDDDLERHKEITSFEYIKQELSLSCKLLKSIDSLLTEAIEYEKYYVGKRREKQDPSVKEWLTDRGVAINVIKRSCVPRVRYRKGSIRAIK